MGLEPHIMKRLALIRYQYETAVKQSKAPPLVRGLSILTMHDAVELFLCLVCENVDIDHKKRPFREYWKDINAKISPKRLEQESSMARLGEVRNLLKHRGAIPSDDDIKHLLVNTTDFMQYNSKIIFGIGFNEVSLVDFVHPEDAKLLLVDAQKDMSKGDNLSALDKIALSFAKIIYMYELEKPPYSGNSPFYFGSHIGFNPSYDFKLDTIKSRGQRNLAECIDNIAESIDLIQDAMKIIALGIDFRKYIKFKMYAPFISPNMSYPKIYERNTQGEPKQPPIEDAQFCFDFVIESALALM